MERGRVVDQLGEPKTALGSDVWVYPNFRAGNVYYSERYDTLLVLFKHDRVARITLTSAQAIRTAIARQKAAAASASALAQK